MYVCMYVYSTFGRNEISLIKWTHHICIYEVIDFYIFVPSDSSYDNESKSKHVAKVVDRLVYR